MQTIVTFEWSSNVANEVVGATASTTNHRADLPVSKVFGEQVHHLYNYGMNACDDRVLVNNSIVQCFLLVGTRPELLKQHQSVVSNVFKAFRRILIQNKGASLFTSRNEMSRVLTSLQQEALFLKFERKLAYCEVAIIMDLPIEQLRRQISKALDNLVRDK